MQIPIYKPETPPYAEVEPDIRKMYESGMFYPGYFTERLITQVKSYCDVRYVLPVNSCSTGLLAALSLIPAGSKVVMPSFTFNATLQALEWNGLVPIVVDVDSDGQLDLDKLSDCLGEHPNDVAGILPVHMWGNLVDVEAVLSRAMGIPYVFFDGAHVFGSTDAGHIHTGDATVFSIAATKPVSAGEGGLIVTNQQSVYEDLSDVVFHGLCGSLDTRLKGINGKIQEFNSILAYHAILHFPQTMARRQKIMEFYRTSCKNLPIRIWEPRKSVDPSYKDCVVFTEDKQTRDALDVFIQQRGIGTKRYFEPAIPDMGSFKGIVHSADNGRRLSDTCLTLPLYPSLSDTEVEYIVNSVKEFFNS